MSVQTVCLEPNGPSLRAAADTATWMSCFFTSEAETASGNSEDSHAILVLRFWQITGRSPATPGIEEHA